jgi:hypothetical protein
MIVGVHSGTKADCKYVGKEVVVLHDLHRYTVRSRSLLTKT